MPEHIVSSSMDVGKARKLKKQGLTLVFVPEFASPSWEKHLRHAVEHGYVDVIRHVERDPKRDSIQKQRLAFNHVYARMCAQHKIIVQIVLDEKTQMYMPRIRAVLLICAKYGAAAQFYDPTEKRNPIDMIALQKILSRPSLPLLSYSVEDGKSI